jgi:selenophosphate synthase
MNDAQTSGGLLIALPEEKYEEFMLKSQKLHQNFTLIGEFTVQNSGLIKIIK